MDENLIKRACLHLEVQPDQIVGSRVDEQWGVYRFLVDYGIKGIKKYAVPFADLPELPEPPKPARTASRRKRVQEDE